METSKNPNNPESFASRALSRIRELNAHATQLTKELGLPPEAKGAVLKGLYDPKAQSAEIGDLAATAKNVPENDSTASSK